MDPEKLNRLFDLFDQDLAGWRITHCHFLELDHGLMGTFPAIDKSGEVVATLDKGSLEKVWQQLERRPAKVTSFMALAHPESGVAFSLENYHKGDTKPLRIFSAKDIETLCEKNAVSWAPGLVQLSEKPVCDPVFT